ncbi:MAG: hypothetical protein K6A76_11325 [Oribacterium sp.]|nr:hypothetical protein [Oribacterium sp.]
MSEKMDKDMNINAELNDEIMEQATGGDDRWIQPHRFHVGQKCWYSDKQSFVIILELTRSPHNKERAYYTVRFPDGRIETYVQDGHLGLLS